MIGPFRFGKNSDFVPNTKINLGYEYFRRSDQYTLNSYKTSFGWQWNSSISTEHQVTPIALNYVVPSDITPQFKTGLDTNITLARSIEKQFIIGSTYNFNYNSQAKPNNKKHNFYFNGNVDFSGNIIGLQVLMCRTAKRKKYSIRPFHNMYVERQSCAITLPLAGEEEKG
jgi:hypothetical protein